MSNAVPVDYEIPGGPKEFIQVKGEAWEKKKSLDNEVFVSVAGV